MDPFAENPGAPEPSGTLEKIEIPEPSEPTDTPEAEAPEAKPEPRKHDETYRQLFNIDVAGRILVRDFVAAGWYHEVRSIGLFRTDFVTPNLKHLLCDFAMWLRLMDNRSVVPVVEFESSKKNRGMVLKTLGYVWAATAALYSNRSMRDPDGSVPRVLPFVVYTGEEPWTAPDTLAELADGSELAPDIEKAVGGLGATYAHAVLDLRRAHAQGLFPEDSVLGWLAALEEDPWDNLRQVLGLVAKHWGRPEHEKARAALAEWTVERMRAGGVPMDVRAGVEKLITNPEEKETMIESYQRWAEGHRQTGIELGEERGIERGQSELVVRQASRRFGATTGGKLAELVEPMNAEQLARVGDAIVDCETGDELLDVAANGCTGGG